MSERCVILVGCMGAGKSIVGRKLAKTLGYDFTDTDSLIEKAAGKKISAIFAESGEPGFRDLEAATIGQLATARAKVIATGGGAVLRPENRALFKALGLSVYLKASARELYQRIKNDTSRPLLTASADPKSEIARILAEREPHYNQADIIVDTEDLSVEEVTDRLIDELARRTLGDG